MVKANHTSRRRRILVPEPKPNTATFPDSISYGSGIKGAIQRSIPPRDQSELKRTILGHSRRIQKSPDRVRKYFEHELIRYAA